MRSLLLFVTLFINLQTASSDSKPIDSEVVHTFSSGSKSTFSKIWYFDESKNVLISPENDLKVFYIETKFDNDVEKLSLSLWKKINPNFNFKIIQKFSPPASDGWEQIHQIVYDVPTKENRTILTVIRVFKGIAYVNLAEGVTGAFERRGSQFQIAINSWKPSGLKIENLGKRTAKKFGKIDEKEFLDFASSLAKKMDIPGVSIAMVQDSKIVFQKSFGVKAIGKKEVVTNTTPFMIGSTTKPLTTLMLAKLVELKKLKWETPVQSILNEFTLADKGMSAQLLIKHTACACTGMPRHDLEFIFETEKLTGEDIIQQMSLFMPTTGFGETFQYSNHLVALGGYAGGTQYKKSNTLISGYEKAMNELVFSPLKMENTFVKPTSGQAYSLPSPHTRDFFGNMTSIPQKMDDMVYSVAPAGSIWSTSGDIARYIIMELNDGKDETGQQLYSSEQIKFRRALGVKVDETTFYGLGLFVENQKGLEIISHGGNTMGFTSEMFFLPKDKIGMVILINAGGVNRYRAILKQKFLEIFYDADIKSNEQIDYAMIRKDEIVKLIKERVSQKSSDTKWIKKFIGKYKNSALGVVEVKATPKGFVFDAGEWSSLLGSVTEKNGDKLFSLISAPWSGGGGEFQVKSVPKKQLIIMNGQIKYEFDEVK